MENLEQYVQLLKVGVIANAPRVVYALIVLFVGLWIIKLLTRLLVKAMDKREIDQSLKPFFRNLVNITLKVLLVVTVIGMLGIQMTSFVAILGAAGLAIGMAMSGMLQNFAGGVIVLIFKPYKVGDYISAQGHSGSVREIQIFNTILKTPDNKTIVIPNGGLSTGSIINFSAESQRKVEVFFGVSYKDDIDKVRSVLKQVIESNEKILKDPEIFIGVLELGDSAVKFVVRVWTNLADYWEVYFYLQETVKKTFDKEGISFPYPQSDVHVYQSK